MKFERNKQVGIISRCLIGIVTFLNLQAAFYFMFDPASYAPGFELVGAPGEAMIQGLGLLFLMWNVPYLIALLDPFKHTTSLLEAVIMQSIGVVGESLILLSIDGFHPQIQASTTRFILFDGAGLVLLIVAFGLVLRAKKHSPA